MHSQRARYRIWGAGCSARAFSSPAPTIPVQAPLSSSCRRGLRSRGVGGEVLVRHQPQLPAAIADNPNQDICSHLLHLLITGPQNLCPL